MLKSVLFSLSDSDTKGKGIFYLLNYFIIEMGYFMEQTHKKIGFGSLSLLLFICGILFSISFSNGESYGDSILRSIGLNPWSNGNSGVHYTIFYSLIFYIGALILGYEFKNDLGAKLGRTLSFITIIFISVSVIFITQPF